MFSFGFIGDFSSLQIHYDCLMVLHEIPARVRVYTACCCDLCCPIGMGPHARLKSTSVSACCQDLLSHRNGTPPPCKTEECQCIQLVARLLPHWNGRSPCKTEQCQCIQLVAEICCPIGMGTPRLKSTSVYSLLLGFVVPSEWDPLQD